MEIALTDRTVLLVDGTLAGRLVKLPPGMRELHAPVAEFPEPGPNVLMKPGDIPLPYLFPEVPVTMTTERYRFQTVEILGRTIEVGLCGPEETGMDVERLADYLLSPGARKAWH